MKKGYYIHFQGRTSVGVAKKIDMQMEELRKFYDMQEIEVGTPKRSLAERLIGLFPTCSIKRNYVQTFKLLENPAFLYIRRTVADRAYVGFMQQVKQKFPDCKIIIEIFTYPYDKDEFGKWNAWPFYLKERIYRGRLKQYVDRFVTYSKDNCIFGIPTIRTANGINVESVRMVQGEYRENRLTMIGAAYMQRQHGYERVIEGLYHYYQDWDGKYRVYLYLVGDGPEKSKYQSLVEKYQLQEYVVFYPTTTGEELDRLYDEAEIALNAFGWYKVGCYDAISTLKIRESFARGIPMISGSPIDIVDENHKYALMFPNDPSPVEIPKVIEYYETLKKQYRKKSNLASELRSYAGEHASMEVVMKPVIDFING